MPKDYYRTSLICFLFLLRMYQWDFGPYRKCEQRRLRRACATTQSRQSLRCSPTQSRYVNLGSDQTLGF